MEHWNEMVGNSAVCEARLTLDLFSDEPGLDRVDMEDADVSFLRHLSLPQPADSLLNELIEQASWRAESVTVWGKTYLQPSC